MKKSMAASAVLVFLLAASLFAEQSIENLKLKKEDLPEGYTFGADIMSVSIQPVTFYKMPDSSGLMPNPVRKDYQTFMFEGKPRGSLLLFQYRNKQEADSVKNFLSGLLWGDPNGPTRTHPEELYGFENVVMVFCFGYRSGEALLVKNFLNERMRINLLTPDDRFMMVIAFARKFYNSNDLQKGIDVLTKNYDSIKNYSFGHYFLAEFYYMAHDWTGAKRHYRSALDLHTTTSKLPDEGSLWAVYHGLGISSAMTGKIDESVEPFRKSLELARVLKRDSMIAGSSYDLSCSLAVLKKYDEAFSLLEGAIKLEKKYRDIAGKDDCFRDAMAQKRFADLLK